MIYHGTIILKRKLFSILTRFNKLSSKNLKIEPCQNLSHAIYNIPLKFNCLWMFNVLMLTKNKCWKLDKNDLKDFFFFYFGNLPFLMPWKHQQVEITLSHYLQLYLSSVNYLNLLLHFLTVHLKHFSLVLKL